ncbi:MAG: threonine aldolase [Phycisphaerales bacterium]|jgi:threonine aldolase|nr:threonine aldolase [Phycisphaerales bacterium]
MTDLFSDTLTKPSKEMRRAMADAEVADEQRREDPTTNALQSRVADILGKEAAVFMPSGAMCNAVAVKTHTQPGEAIVCDRRAHVYRSEFGGAALLSGVTTEPIDTERGIFSVDEFEAVLANFGAYGATPRVLCVEQTHNFGAGAIWPLDQLRKVCDAAHARGMKTHMDGARLFNASVASKIPPRDYAASCDSVWIDLSKGLGCPVGAVLAGTKEFIDRAWRWKHAFGGAMRQSGILAAAGLYALDHNIARLADDHANARLLAEALSTIKGVRLDPGLPETNIIFFDTAAAGISPVDFVAKLLDLGVRMGHISRRVRAVTHLDVSRADIERTIETVRRLLASAAA